MMRRIFPVALVVLVGAVLIALGTTGDDEPVATVPGGRAVVGRELIAREGCTSCHRIAGFREPTGRVGPELADFHRDRLIAGRVANTPENLVRWLMDPQGVSPGTIMPDLGLSAAEARDIAAYLYEGG